MLRIRQIQIITFSEMNTEQIPRTVFEACVELRLWPAVVPAKCTWLLQPLDTHVFRSFKTQLRKDYHAAVQHQEKGQLSNKEFIACLSGTIAKVCAWG